MNNRHILLATSNAAKIKQYKEVIASMYGKGVRRPFIVHTLTPKMLKRLDGATPEEDGESTAENAIIKATYYARLTGMITISDDSAFCVDALGSQPGLTSHRMGWNEYEVLKRLYKSGNEHRRAHYVTTVVACIPDPDMESPGLIGKTSTLHGTVIEPMIGDDAEPVFVRSKDCYGYDAIFRPNNSTGGVGFSGTVDGLLHSGNRMWTRLGIGYPRSVAARDVLTTVANRYFLF